MKSYRGGSTAWKKGKCTDLQPTVLTLQQKGMHEQIEAETVVREARRTFASDA